MRTRTGGKIRDKLSDVGSILIYFASKVEINLTHTLVSGYRDREKRNGAMTSLALLLQNKVINFENKEREIGISESYNFI